MCVVEGESVGCWCRRDCGLGRLISGMVDAWLKLGSSFDVQFRLNFLVADVEDVCLSSVPCVPC